jgi:2-C-methyl-D-erythritol 4-phosphate cytidylyltransferase
MEDVWVVVVAAGSGRRFGGAKQYEALAGRRVLDWSLSAARQAARRASDEGGEGDDGARHAAGGVVLVVAPGHEGDPEPGADVVVAGAETRSGSVRAGLAAVPAGCEVIVVHDGARPLAEAALFARVVDAVAKGADAAIPGVAVDDTLRARAGGVVDRDGLVAVQTPQAFRAAALRAAHAGGAEATDDASLVEAAGGKVVVVDGSPTNLKITRPADLVVAEALLRGR